MEIDACLPPGCLHLDGGGIGDGCMPSLDVCIWMGGGIGDGCVSALLDVCIRMGMFEGFSIGPFPKLDYHDEMAEGREHTSRRES